MINGSDEFHKQIYQDKKEISLMTINQSPIKKVTS